MTGNRWLTRWPRPSEPRLRLICFPYAGGGASLYWDWARYLPVDVEVCAVQLPGRENRINERPYTRLLDLIPALAEALGEVTDRPYVTFGYSLGSLISFEYARHQRRTGGRVPEHLMVAARRPPQLPNRHPPIHALPDPQFVAAIRLLSGTDPRVFESPDLLTLVLPMLRADFAVSERYRYQPEPPLECPITVFRGSADSSVTPAEAQEWASQTSGPLDVYTLDGDHFFLRTEQARLLAEVTNVLAGVGSEIDHF